MCEMSRLRQQKRQRVSDAFVAPVDPAPAPTAGPVDTWSTATSQNVVQKQASEHLTKGHSTSTDIQNLQWNSTAPATKVVAWEHGLFFSILVILSVQLELPFLHMKNLDSIDSLGFFLQSVC